MLLTLKLEPAEFSATSLEPVAVFSATALEPVAVFSATALELAELSGLEPRCQTMPLGGAFCRTGASTAQPVMTSGADIVVCAGLSSVELFKRSFFLFCMSQQLAATVGTASSV